MWILPTLNRIEKLKTFLESFRETQGATPGLIVPDVNDYAAHKDAYESLRLPENWKVRPTEAVTMGDKCRELWPELGRREWVGLLNDDHFCVSKEWDKAMIGMVDGTNFVSANDRWMAPIKATTATIWSMPLLKAVGWPIYPPRLKHLFIDDVWENLGRATGCWRIQMKAVVEHRHVLNGAQKDQTHNEVYGAEFPARPSKMWDEDKATFDNFMKHDFHDAVKKIQDFQNILHGQRYNPDTYKK